MNETGHLAVSLPAQPLSFYASSSKKYKHPLNLNTTIPRPFLYSAYDIFGTSKMYELHITHQ